MSRSGKTLALTFSLLTLCCVALAPAAPDAPAGGSGAALSREERGQLLQRLEAIKEKYPSIEANFTEKRRSRLLKKPLESKGTIQFDIPNRFRREVGGTSPSLTVSNGKVLWLYYPNFKEAELYTLGQRAMFDDAMAALTAGLNFSRVEAYYDLEAYLEKGGYRMTLSPRKSNLKRIVQSLTVYFDADLNVYRTALTLPKGDEVITDYSGTRRGKLAASIFEFTPPEGVNVTRPLGK